MVCEGSKMVCRHIVTFSQMGHKLGAFWECFWKLSKNIFCRILGVDIYKMWEVLGERRVRWGANTLSPAAQGRGRVLAFFSNNGSQIGSFFGSFPRYR